MGLSRRQFTKEFKLTAVRRLEQGVSKNCREYLFDLRWPGGLTAIN